MAITFTSPEQKAAQRAVNEAASNEFVSATQTQADAYIDSLLDGSNASISDLETDLAEMLKKLFGYMKLQEERIDAQEGST